MKEYKLKINSNDYHVVVSGLSNGRADVMVNGQSYSVEIADAQAALPDVPAALTLQLTVQDVEAIDTDPAALGRRLVGSPAGKCWLTHPRAETFLAERVALLQRVYRR